jgi:hypothetical protein
VIERHSSNASPVHDEVGEDGIGDCVAAVSAVNLGLKHLPRPPRRLRASRLRQVVGGHIGKGDFSERLVGEQFPNGI